MIAKVEIGIGGFGKLWTGHTPEPGIYNVVMIERTCPCGATTKKFRAYPVPQPLTFGDCPTLADALDLPTVFITAGGVGSLCVDHEGTGDGKGNQLTVWNWSGREGGHVIANPLMVLSGYWSRFELPETKAGFRWLQTYGGNTLSEFVLVAEGRHVLPVVQLSGTCPPCREKAQAESVLASLPPAIAELVARASAAFCGGGKRQIDKAIARSESALFDLCRENAAHVRDKVQWEDLDLPTGWKEAISPTVGPDGAVSLASLAEIPPAQAREPRW